MDYHYFAINICLIHTLIYRLSSKRGTGNFWRAMPSRLHNRDSLGFLLMVFFGLLLGYSSWVLTSPIPPLPENRDVLMRSIDCTVWSSQYKLTISFLLKKKKKDSISLKQKANFTLGSVHGCGSQRASVLHCLRFELQKSTYKECSPSLWVIQDNKCISFNS